MDSVVVENISMSYNSGNVLALDQVSFSVEKGGLFGLIGPDGAGKTSMFRILTTLLMADSGAASIDGYDLVKDYRKIRSIVGYMPGKFSLYQDLSVEENLNFFATLFNTSIAENYDLIKDIYVQIEPFKKRRAGKLSGGMKQKLALCCALIHRPQVLFLDEPTTGVDTVSRKEFWGMLKRLKEQGITIVVSTPYMDEASLCERIALIQEGKILSIDTPEGIIDQYNGKLLAIKSAEMSHLLKDLREAPAEFAIRTCFSFGEYHHLSFQKDREEQRNMLQKYLLHRGHQQLEMKAIRPGIEDCFIQLMN